MDTRNTKNTQDTNPIILKKNRIWLGTLNNWDDDDVVALEDEIDGLEDYAWQSEIGEEGTPHLQIALKYRNAREFKTMKNKFPRANWRFIPEDPKTGKSNWLKVKKYCAKSKTSTGEIKKEKGKLHLIDPMAGKTPYPWQQMVLDLIEEMPDDRSIHWFWEKTGNAGKTSLAKHLCIKYPKECLYVTGKAADIKCGITKFVENGNNPRILIMDLVRSIESFVSYQGIEEMKNAIFFNTKYESGMVLYNPPHVFVFANFRPQKPKLSHDRWHSYNIETPPAESKD